MPAKSWTTVPTGLAIAVPSGVRMPFVTIPFTPGRRLTMACADLREGGAKVGAGSEERD